MKLCSAVVECLHGKQKTLGLSPGGGHILFPPVTYITLKCYCDDFLKLILVSAYQTKRFYFLHDFFFLSPKIPGIKKLKIIMNTFYLILGACVNRLDIVFVVDSSSSLSQPEKDAIGNAVENVLNRYCDTILNIYFHSSYFDTIFFLNGNSNLFYIGILAIIMQEQFAGISIISITWNKQHPEKSMCYNKVDKIANSAFCMADPNQEIVKPVAEFSIYRIRSN